MLDTHLMAVSTDAVAGVAPKPVPSPLLQAWPQVRVAQIPAFLGLVLNPKHTSPYHSCHSNNSYHAYVVHIYIIIHDSTWQGWWTAVCLPLPRTTLPAMSTATATASPAAVTTTVVVVVVVECRCGGTSAMRDSLATSRLTTFLTERSTGCAIRRRHRQRHRHQHQHRHGHQRRSTPRRLPSLARTVSLALAQCSLSK